jgi:PAS domain S-box-containing protein
MLDSAILNNETNLGEDKLRSILNYFPDIISLISIDGTYLEQLPNNAGFDLVRDRNDFIGKNILELLPEKIALRKIQGIQQALSTGEVQIFEQTIEINNCLKYEEVRIIPLQEDAAVVIVRDVSDRKIAEENLKKQYQRSQLLAEVTLEIRQSLQIDEILQTTVTELQKIFEVDRTLVFQFQPDGTGIIAKESVTEQFTAIIDQHLDDPCFRLQQADQYAKGKFSKIENIDTDDLSPCYADFLRQFDVKASIVISIVHNDNLWGLLIVQQCDRPRQWADFEIELMQQLADQLAIAITQSQLIADLEQEVIWNKTVFDNSFDGILIMDIKGNVIQTNTSFATMLGYSVEEMAKLSIYDLDVKWTREELERGIQEFKTGKSVKFETLHQMKGGAIRNLEVTASSAKYQDQNIIFSICRDITQRKLSEIALSKSLQREQMLNQLIQIIRSSLDLGVVFNSAVDEIAKLLELEQAAIVQYLPERKIWKHVAVFRDNPEIIDSLSLEIPDENNPLATKLKQLEIVQIRDARELEDPINSQLAQHASGSWLMVPIIVNAKIWGSLSVRKISSLIYWEVEIIELTQAIANQLAISIQQVTLYEQLQMELAEHKQTEVKLEYSKELAEAANKAKSEFLANMSHEIRTPMNGVLGMAQLLASTSLDDEQKSYLQTILDSGDALLTIINDILDFSKIESGNLELERKEFNLIDTVNSVCNLLSKQAFDKNISLQCQIHDNLPKNVIGDSSRLRQILINLMGNAIKFTQSGSVEMRISGQLINSNPDRLTYDFRFAIADTGIGLDNEQIQKLFYPFTQADASINRKFGGTGLGLAICKRLVELMQGTIWVESRGAVGGNPPLDWVSEGLSQGSTFHFAIALPLGKQAPIKRQVETFSEIKVIDQETPIKILLVEDNVFNQKVALLMLKKLGYKADVAGNGREAVEHVSEKLNSANAYDLIFMDVQMPIMDGRTATKIIRENSASKIQPWIVALTADALPDDQQACHDSGMNDYISKPVHIQELVRVISNYQHLGRINAENQSAVVS